MRRMIVLLMAGALMVMVGAAPASAQVIIEAGLAVTEGRVVVESPMACNTLGGTAGFEWRAGALNNPFPPGVVSSSNPLAAGALNTPFPPALAGGEVCWLELPGWDAAALQLAAASPPNNPFPPT
jgi:hypothetical protein